METSCWWLVSERCTKCQTAGRSFWAKINKRKEKRDSCATGVVKFSHAKYMSEQMQLLSASHPYSDTQTLRCRSSRTSAVLILQRQTDPAVCVCVCGEMGAYLWRKSVVSSLLFMTVCRRTCRFYSLSLCVLYNVDWSVFMIVSELTFGYETSEQFGSCLVCYASSVVYIMLENLPGVTFLLYFPSVLLLKDYWTFT